MEGVYIEAKPLTAKQALSILEVMQQSAIKASGSGDYLAAFLSMKRIADGVDTVIEKQESDT